MNKKLTKFLIIVVLFFSYCLITNAQSPEQNKTYLNYIKQAQKFESQNKISEANQYYLKAQKIFPDRFEAKFGLAKTYGWLHKDKLALKYYQELLKEFPNNVALLEAYAKYLKDNKDYDKALNIYNKLFNLTKNNKYKVNIAEINLLQKNQLYLNYIKQAKEYERQNNIPEAKKYYLKAQKIFPTRYEALFGLARIYSLLYKNKLEFKYYQEKFKETPKDVSFLEEYAKYLKDNQDYDQALKIYNRLFELTKNNKYKVNIAEIISLKNYQEQNKKFLSYIKQAQENESQNKISEANKYYLKALEIFPDRYEAKFGLAKTYGWLHKDELALEYYQELLKQAPNNVALLEAYAVYLKDNKDYDQTLEIYNKLFVLTKNDKYKANIAEIISLKKIPKPKQNYQEQNKKFSNSLKANKKYITKPKYIVKFKKSYAVQNQNSAQNQIFLSYIKQAQAYEQQGKIPEANKYYLKAQEIFPDRYEAKFGLAKTYGWLHKDELALEYYQELLKKSPDNA